MGVASRWNCRCGDACYDPRYDMDDDCDVDVVDIMRVASRWQCRCGDVCYGTHLPWVEIGGDNAGAGDQGDVAATAVAPQVGSCRRG